MKEKEERDNRIATEIAITAANEIFRRAEDKAFADVVKLSDLAEICNQISHPLEKELTVDEVMVEAERFIKNPCSSQGLFMHLKDFIAQRRNKDSK